MDFSDSIVLELRTRLKNLMGLVVHDDWIAHDAISQQNLVFKCSTGVDSVFVKIYKEEFRYRRELKSLEKFHALQLPVATILKAGSWVTSNRESLFYLVLGELDGESAQKILDNNSTSETCSSIGKEVALFLKRINVAEQYNYSEEFRKSEHSTFMEFAWRRLLYEHKNFLVGKIGIDTRFLEEMRDEVIATPNPTHFSWVTFDFRLRHVLLQTGSVNGILDLEYAAVHDRLIDLSSLVHDIAVNESKFDKMSTLDAIFANIAYDESYNFSFNSFRLYLMRFALTHIVAKYDLSYPRRQLERELACFYLYHKTHDLHELMHKINEFVLKGQ